MNVGRNPKSAEVVALSRESAGWQYVSFSVWDLKAGQTIGDTTGAEEVGLVVLSGTVAIDSPAGSWQSVGRRGSVFDGNPYVVYLPPSTDFVVTAVTDTQVARAAALVADGEVVTSDAYLITPDDILVEQRGEGNARRSIRHLLEADRPANHLFLVECVTPSGNWSSYPPHKHDMDDYPRETYLEETYYHRIQPDQGFGFQRIYTRDDGRDDGIVIKDGSLVAVAAGYHPVVVAPGYELYYLNVMAGPIREWRFTDDPDHAWVKANWDAYGTEVKRKVVP